MRIEVLGCHGDLTPGAASPGYLLDGRLLLDAGTVCSALPPARALKIDDVLLSHLHVDHVKELPFLISAAAGRRSAVRVWSAAENLARLSAHLFNSVLWPDFTRLPSAKNPAMRLRKLSLSSATRVGRYQVRLVAVDHTVLTHGMFIDDGRRVLGYTADTRPCPRFWDVAAGLGRRLAAVICEVTFDDAQQQRAAQTGHMTPRLLAAELNRAGIEAPLVAVHLRPELARIIERQLAQQGVKAHVCAPGELLRL